MPATIDLTWPGLPVKSEDVRIADVALGSETVKVRLATETDGVPLIGPIDVAFAESRSAASRPLVLGCGPLSRLEVPGSNRLVVAGFSPLWNGLGISTLGSAALSLHELGLHALVLRG